MNSNESLVHAVECADRVDRINVGNNQVEEPTKETDIIEDANQVEEPTKDKDKIDAGTNQVEESMKDIDRIEDAN